MNWQAVVTRAQATRDSAYEPDPLLRGGLIEARTLELLPISIDPLHIFAASAIIPATEEERTAAAAYLGMQPPQHGHSHHISLDYAKLVRLGVRGILAEIEAFETRLDATPENAERRLFYAGARLALAGLVQYGARYREEATRLLRHETDPQRQRELQRIADALARVPFEPATTLFEAIQSMLLLHFGSRANEADSAVGRLDYYLDAYYQRDLDTGRITREEAAQWMQMLLAQLLELSRFSDCIVLAGCEADGVTPFANDLTYFILDAMAHLCLPGPQLGFRYSPGHPRDLLRRAMACVYAGSAHPGFFNDPVAISGLQRAGMTREQAADYANCNCVELTSAGRSYIISGYNYTNLVKPIEIMLNGGTPLVEETDWWSTWRLPPSMTILPQEYPTFDAFLAAYEQYLDAIITQLVADTNATFSNHDGTLLPLSSVFIDGCLARGRHARLGGAVCSQTFPSFVGFANAVDALAAIRQAVYEEQVVTLVELATACRENFAEGAELLRYLRTRCPKYGNDDQKADALAERLYNRIADRFQGLRNWVGQAYAPQYFGFMSHAARGQYTAATPDGRLRGASVAGTLGGDYGADIAGPTALLASVTRLDHTRASGGVAVNMTLSPAALRTEEDRERVLDLLLTYFSLGGMQLQYNYITSDILRAAQQQPDQYRRLMVRVAGYADRFVCLPRNLQDEIISRTQHGMMGT